VPRAWLRALPARSAEAADALAHRFAGLCAVLTRLLSPPARVLAASATATAGVAQQRRAAVPVRALVALALRVLGVTSVVDVAPRVRVSSLDVVDDATQPTTANATAATPTLLTRGEATALLPSLRADALALLTCVTRVAPAHALRHADALCETCVGALQLSSTAASGDATRRPSVLFASTRASAYALALALLDAGAATIDARRFVTPLTQHAIADVAVAGDAAASQATRCSALGVLSALLRLSPLALAPATRRACAAAIVDAAVAPALLGRQRATGADAPHTLSATAARVSSMATPGGSATQRLAVTHALAAALRTGEARPAAQTALAWATHDAAADVRETACVALADGVGVGAHAVASLRADRALTSAISLAAVPAAAAAVSSDTRVADVHSAPFARHPVDAVAVSGSSIARAEQASQLPAVRDFAIAAASFVVPPPPTTVSASTLGRRHSADDTAARDARANDEPAAKRARVIEPVPSVGSTAAVLERAETAQVNVTHSTLSLLNQQTSNIARVIDDDDDADAADDDDDASDGALLDVVMAPPDEEDALSESE
jgi:hypothetical protein